MILIVAIVLELLGSLVFFNLGLDGEIVSLLFIILNALTCSFIFIKVTPKKIAFIMILALLLRILVMIIDSYTQFPILFSGVDSETFDQIARDNVSLGCFAKSLTSYTDFLTIIYSLFDSQRIVAQYLNVVLGVSSIYLLYRILLLLDIDEKSIIKSCLLLSIFPAHLFISSILLRDVLVIFFSTYSLYFFILWSINAIKINMLMTYIMLFVATYFHSGIIFLAIGYTIFFTLWKPRKQQMEFSVGSIMFLSLVTLIGVFIISRPELFLSKFASLEEQDLASRVASDRVEAGSQYLIWVNPTNIFELILYSPLKMLYFMFSPMPWDIRNILDVLTILLDSSVFIFLSYMIYKYKVKRNRVKIVKNYVVANSLIIGVLFATFAFSWGVIASGTAMRHREKLIILLLTLYLLRKKIYNESYKNNNYSAKS